MSRFLQRAVVLGLPSLLLACSNNPKNQLQGKWVGDSVENFSQVERVSAEPWVSGTSFEFTGSRVSIAIPAETPREGKFEVTKLTEGTLSLAFVRPDKVRDNADFRIEQDGRLRWQLGDGRSVLLRKVAN